MYSHCMADVGRCQQTKYTLAKYSGSQPNTCVCAADSPCEQPKHQVVYALGSWVFPVLQYEHPLVQVEIGLVEIAALADDDPYFAAEPLRHDMVACRHIQLVLPGAIHGLAAVRTFQTAASPYGCAWRFQSNTPESVA
jgi:hypothetical protein